MQKTRTDNTDLFAEQCLENHFSILQMCIRANKTKTDARQVRNSCYSLGIVCSYRTWRAKLTIQHGPFCCSRFPRSFCITAPHWRGLSLCGEQKMKEHVHFYQKHKNLIFDKTVCFLYFGLHSRFQDRRHGPLFMEEHIYHIIINLC